uniref:Uncharacterized protein n=1 Tax=Romanomermis culicivorax TaxID=13658 RepID=A0A915JP87_ROMCU
MLAGGWLSNVKMTKIENQDIDIESLKIAIWQISHDHEKDYQMTNMLQRKVEFKLTEVLDVSRLLALSSCSSSMGTKILGKTPVHSQPNDNWKM